MAQFRPHNIALIVAGAATALANGVGIVVVNPAVFLAAHNITTPANAKDRDTLVILFGGTIAAGAPVVAAFAMTAGGTSTILAPIPGVGTSGLSFKMQYCKGTDSWYLI